MKVQDFIKDKRISLGLTMKEVADYVGVSEATVSRWESGDISNMKRSRIYKLSQILKISPAILCYEEVQEEQVKAADHITKKDVIKWIENSASFEDLSDIFQVISKRFGRK